MLNNETTSIATSTVLLEETFYVQSKTNCVFRVQLTSTGLCLAKEMSQTRNISKQQFIAIDDIIGSRCLRSKKRSKIGCTSCQLKSLPHSNSLQVVEDTSAELDDNDASVYLYIYAYIIHGNSAGSSRSNNNNSVTNSAKKERRERAIITLRFRSFDKYEDNNREAQKWRYAIKKICHGEVVNRNDLMEIQNSERVMRFKDNRRLLVLCNPKSGSGKAKSVFQSKVAPILQEAEILYDLHMTRHANYARDFIKNSNLYQWTGIVAVGGDGIFFEILNGIFERLDWLEVLKSLPLGIIPCGSGNGLARSIAHHCNEPYPSSNTSLPATLAMVKRNIESIDLVRVETKSEIMFSFLSVGWGLISDIDIESESLRMLGGQRFTIWSVARLIGLRDYGGKLYYLPAQNVDTKNGWSHDMQQSQDTQQAEGDSPLKHDKRPRLDSWYSATSHKSTYYSVGESCYQSTANSGDAAGTDNISSPIRSSKRIYGPASVHLPCLTTPLNVDEQLNGEWKLMEGRFVLIHASYPSHLSEDCFFVPPARLNDGLIWLLIVRAGATRSQLLHFLLGLSSGSHISILNEGKSDEEKLVELIPVLAFRIEPDADCTGCMTVDGERVEYGPIQAEVFPRLGRIMVP